MGPHFFKCGKSGYERLRRKETQCFNGAALFQVRKDNTKTRQWKSFAQLQWGRTFSSAESQKNFRFFDALARRFNGAALFQVRKV